MLETPTGGFLFLIEVISIIALNTIKILRTSPQHRRVFLVLFVGKIPIGARNPIRV
jgi:hypothetical protein